MILRPPRSTQSRSSAASDVYKRQAHLDAAQIRRPEMEKEVGEKDPDTEGEDQGVELRRGANTAQEDPVCDPGRSPRKERGQGHGEEGVDAELYEEPVGDVPPEHEVLPMR